MGEFFTENRTETKNHNRKEFKNEREKRLPRYRGGEQDGRDRQRFNTRAIVYVKLEIDEDKVNEGHGSDLSCGFCTSQYIDRILAYEMLGITDGLWGLIDDITEEHPELELLALLCNQRTINLGDKEE